MKLIVGLGNPTAKYDETRHNAGFEVIDRLVDKYNVPLDTMKHKGIYGKGIIEGGPVLLLKPMTYMNLSGESVSAVANYYKISPEDIIIICDDINLEVGRLRIRKKGSAGGHNGLKNIIMHLNTEDFSRLRIGVGMKPANMDLAAYVTSHFHKDDLAVMNISYDRACEVIALMAVDRIDEAMNLYNGK